MRYLILFVLCTSFSLGIKAQCDSSLIGVWKPISVITGEIRFDFTNDSLSVSRERRISNSDSSSQNMMRDMIKLMFHDFQCTFRKDGSFEIMLYDDLKDEGTYCFNREKEVIILTSKNSLGEPVATESKASFIKGILYLKMDMGEDDIFEVVLKRKNNTD